MPMKSEINYCKKTFVPCSCLSLIGMLFIRNLYVAGSKSPTSSSISFLKAGKIVISTKFSLSMMKAIIFSSSLIRIFTMFEVDIFLSYGHGSFSERKEGQGVLHSTLLSSSNMPFECCNFRAYFVRFDQTLKKRFE